MLLSVAERGCATRGGEDDMAKGKKDKKKDKKSKKKGKK